MRYTKWIFVGYLLFIGLLAAVIAAGFSSVVPRDPDTLYTVYPANIKSMDPAICNDTIGAAIIGNVYETLYGYKYGVQPYELYPQLAAAMPDISKDGLTYTIKLRTGVHFYDSSKELFRDGMGPEVKAADVIYSWKRVADFGVASPNFATMLQGRVAGIDDWNAYTEKAGQGHVDYDSPVEGLRSLDDYTVQIKLTARWPQFKFQLAFGAGAVVSRAAVEYYGDRFDSRPVGTGPYVLQENLPDQRIIFVANPGYRGRPDVNGGALLAAADRLPHIQRLQYEYFPDALPVWFLFRKKLFDYAGVPKESYDQAINPRTLGLQPALAADGVVLDRAPEPTIYYIGFNMGDPVVGKNKSLRQAMSMALDREKYIRVYLNGRGVPANGPIPPSFAIYDAKTVDPYSVFDLAAAKRKMAEAVKVNGGQLPPLKYLVGATDPETRQDAEFFVSEMRELGLTIVPDYKEWARFQEQVDARETQIYQNGWSPDYPDEQTFLQLFYGKNAPAGQNNSSAYVNPAFDRLYEEASTLEPSPHRDELYRQMVAIVNEDCPWIYLDYPIGVTLNYNWVTNLKTMDYGAGYRQFVTLDVARRQDALSRGARPGK